MKSSPFALPLFIALTFAPVLLSTAAAHTTFDVPLAQAFGNQSNGIAAADLNGDDETDLVLSNSGNSTISILMNNGTGTFAETASHAVAFRPMHVITAKLDGDADLDIAVINQNAATVSILLNDGTGTFTSNVQYTAGMYPRFVAAGDLDGDTDLDLAVAGGGFLSILLNNGSGAFATLTDTFLGGYIQSAAIGNLDGDLDNDIVVTNGGAGDVLMLRNLGGATFAPPVVFDASPNTLGITLADLDSDTDLDVATSNGAEFTVSVLFNDGNGSFGPSTNYRTGNNYTSGRVIHASDMDDDGDLDLLVTNGPPVGSGVSVLFNDGSGTFAPPLNMLSSSNNFLALPTYEAVPVMLDGDDLVDFVAVGNGGGTFSGIVLALNRPDIAMFSQPPAQLPSGDKPVFAALADLDDDDDLDLAVINQDDHELAIHFNAGNATFSTPTTYAAGVLPTCVAAGDFDGDTDVDLATADAHNATDDVHVHWNNGAGAFPNSTVINMTGGFFANVGYLAAADLDGDPDLDLAAAESGASHVAVLINTSGTFAAPVLYGAGYRPKEVQAVDVDDDDDFDLIVANASADAILLRNAGNGTFGPEIFVSVTMDQLSIPVADFDGDTDPDFALSLNSIGPAALSFNDGNGSFEPATTFFGGYWVGASRGVAGDFDNDTDFDLAIASSSASNVTHLRNPSGPDEGTGTFNLPVTYVAGLNPLGIASGDLDGDGDLDLAVANTMSDDVSILLNKTISTPTSVSLPQWRHELSPNWPNPFQQATHFRLAVPRASQVKLAIYDVRGALVATIVDGILPEGVHEVIWDGRDSSGMPASAGTYFCRLHAGDTVDSRRLVLVR
jgi:hypothetical protein